MSTLPKTNRSHLQKKVIPKRKKSFLIIDVFTCNLYPPSISSTKCGAQPHLVNLKGDQFDSFRDGARGFKFFTMKNLFLLHASGKHDIPCPKK